MGGDGGDLGQDGPVLAAPIEPAQALADVPVGGVQELHCHPANPTGGVRDG